MTTTDWCQPGATAYCLVRLPSGGTAATLVLLGKSDADGLINAGPFGDFRLSDQQPAAKAAADDPHVVLVPMDDPRVREAEALRIALWRETEDGGRRHAGSIQPDGYEHIAAGVHRSKNRRSWARLDEAGAWWRLTEAEARATVKEAAPGLVAPWFPRLYGRERMVHLRMPADLLDRLDELAAEEFGGNRTLCVISLLDGALRRLEGDE